MEIEIIGPPEAFAAVKTVLASKGMAVKVEPARTRVHGTKVHNPKTAEELLAAFRDVAASGFAKVSGVAVDITTATMVATTYDALGADHGAKWMAKINGYYSEGKAPNVILAFWVTTFWKAHKAATR